MPAKPKNTPAPASKKELTEEEKKISRETLEDWLKSKATFQEAQANERLHRATIATALGVEGKSRTTTVHGYKVEVQNGTDYTVQKDIAEFIFPLVVEKVREQEAFKDAPEALIHNEADRLIESVLKFEPTLRVSGYKALTDELRAVFDEYITTKPSSAQVKVEKVVEKNS